MEEIEKVAVPVVNDKIQGQIAELIKKISTFAAKVNGY
jgi:hypothetical protein